MVMSTQGVSGPLVFHLTTTANRERSAVTKALPFPAFAGHGPQFGQQHAALVDHPNNGVSHIETQPSQPGALGLRRKLRLDRNAVRVRG